MEGDDYGSRRDALVHIVKFLDRETVRGGHTHRTAMEKAQHWQRLLVALLHIEELKQRRLPEPTRLPDPAQSPHCTRFPHNR